MGGSRFHPHQAALRNQRQRFDDSSFPLRSESKESAHWIHIVLILVNSRMPCMSNSRPEPDHHKQPKREPGQRPPYEWQSDRRPQSSRILGVMTAAPRTFEYFIDNAPKGLPTSIVITLAKVCLSLLPGPHQPVCPSRRHCFATSRKRVCWYPAPQPSILASQYGSTSLNASLVAGLLSAVSINAPLHNIFLAFVAMMRHEVGGV